MRSISEFFKDIKGRQARAARLRTVVQEAVIKHAGVRVPLEAISLSAGAAVLKGLDQTEKSVVFIKKTAILAEIGARLGDGSVADMRSAA
jgi:hypothetical protein